MKYSCEECEKEYGMKVNAQNHAKNTGHINFERIEEDTQTSITQ